MKCICKLRPASSAALFLIATLVCAQAATTNQVVRIMAANLSSGNFMSYEAPGIRIFQGLKPDIVAIQEFRYEGSSADTQLRALVDLAFGPEFSFYREPYTAGGDIPNGIVSRWPIRDSGSWDDPVLDNRGFAWARIDLPGPEDLYVVSVHLYTGSSTDRNTEATTIKNQIQSQFLPGAWVVVAGDLNTDNRSEPAVDTFRTFLSDNPVPTDQDGIAGTSANRSKPYDYVLPSFSFNTNFVSLSISNLTFPNGLVFDSRVFTNLASVPPVLTGDSGVSGMQHMGVLKSFKISYSTTNATDGQPLILAHPQPQSVNPGDTATFTVAATGNAPLSYQWRFNSTSIAGATASDYARTNVQPVDGGNYYVVVSNLVGSVTSSPAVLTVGLAPSITTPPQNQAVSQGSPAVFTVAASGTAPLSYQWKFGAGAIAGATTTSLTISSVQPTNAGTYSVIVSNDYGSTTSAVASLVLLPVQSGTIIAQWDFNSTNTALNSPPASTGSGQIALVGGTTAAWVQGAGSMDSAATNNAWNTTTYPAQGTGNKTAGVQFNVSTSGRQDIVVRWDNRASNTGTKYARLLYSTNGVTFVDFPAAVTVGTSFQPRTNSLAGIPGVSNNPNFSFRVVAEFESTATDAGNAAYAGAGTTYAPAGTLRFDYVTVTGNPISPAMVAPAVLSSPILDGQGIRFSVTGTPGVAYVVERCADLNQNLWLPVQTNTSPFVFSELGNTNALRRFFRAVFKP